MAIKSNRRLGTQIGSMIGGFVNSLRDAQAQQQREEANVVRQAATQEYYDELGKGLQQWRAQNTSPAEVRLNIQNIFERVGRPVGLKLGKTTESIISDYAKEYETQQKALGETAASKVAVAPILGEALQLEEEEKELGPPRRMFGEAVGQAEAATALPPTQAIATAERAVEPLKRDVLRDAIEAKEAGDYTEAQSLAFKAGVAFDDLEQFKPEVEEVAKPQTAVGKARADFKAGIINEEDFNKILNDLFPEPDGELSEEDRFKRAKDIRGEVAKATSDFDKVAQAAARVQASAVEASPAGDLALVFNFMKILDPGSVVRESEFRSAAAAKAWLVKMEESGITVPAIVADWIRKATKGTILTPQQRRDFVERAGKLFEAQEQVNKSTIGGFIKLGERFNLAPEDIIVEKGRPRPFGEFIKSLGQEPPAISDPVTLELETQFPAAANNGTRKVDDATGVIYESDGTTWRRVQ